MLASEKVGLGTVQFGLPYGISNTEGQTKREEVHDILQLAKENKISVLDSASAYGNAEEVLGKFDLSHFKVVSKFMPEAKGISLESQFEQSLKKLNINKLFAYLAHRPLELIQERQSWEYLLHLKKEGVVSKIGFSLNEPFELSLLLDKGFIPDLIQVPYNYFDRRFEPQIKELKKKGCEIHTRSSFLQGLFFMETATLNSHFDQVKPEIEKLQSKVSFLPGALLQFVTQQPFIDKVIIGVQNQQQLKDNLKGLLKAEKLPDLEISVSEKILIPSLWPKN
jgi:aryl-alcohol dehydrogenase-like predicted oxidoreductase